MEKRLLLEKLHMEQINLLNEVVRVCNKYNLTYFLVGGTLLGAVRHKGFIPWDDDLDISMPREDYEKLVKIFSNDLKDDYYIDYYNTNNKYFKPFAKIKKKNTLFIEKSCKNVNGNNEIWVDIFPLDYCNDNSNLKLFKYFIDRIHHINMAKANVDVSFGKVKYFIVKYMLFMFKNNFLGKIQEKLMKHYNYLSGNKYYINYGSQYGIVKQKHSISEYYPVKKLLFEGFEYTVPNNYDYVLKKIYGNDYMTLPPVEKRVTHNPVMIKFSDGEEIHFDNE